MIPPKINVRTVQNYKISEFLSEVMRSENYYKDGWSNGFVEEFYDKPDDPYAELRLEFGRDEEGHAQHGGLQEDQHSTEVQQDGQKCIASSRSRRRR